MLKSNEYDYSNFPNTFYHGTTTEHVQSILTSIDVTKGREFVDFGRGFYLTSDYNQAYRQAKRKANKPYKDAIVQLELDRHRLFKEYNGLIFDTMNEDWAEFIYMARSKKVKNTSDYDFVYGPVADGKIFRLIDLLDNDRIELKAFLEGISQYSSYKQLSIHNQGIVAYNILSDIRVVK
ncbi:DUF3990 domain-containing protein [Allobacillus sp. SKP2-8]|uniref:DUF3990 domain-containing protein n=1 Tax=unclassified Allobacillus TaxID=2628859 RepID=UPI00118431FD|nr:DUF3990 domain-containing protein [Allobacillus sp. SKP2-8]TSJ65006.1 DUF3990 domain-containing protein [Allobacillus sp. SKP2-8]